jgi:DNA-binding transcriptional ArsR family regulator
VNIPVVQLRTLQIATFGLDMQEGIAAGIRNFPVHKLALICYSSDNQKAEEFARKIRNVLGVPVTITVVSRENVIRDVLERVGETIGMEGKNFEQILMNVSCGDKLIGCAMLSAAFINGVKAFGMDSEGAPLAMPVLKLSYSEIISEPKLKILKAVEQVGGAVDSLEKLEEASGYGKPLLSYHIMGGKEARGLAELGLVEVEKGDRGRLMTKLTTLGKLLVLSNNSISSTTQQQK